MITYSKHAIVRMNERKISVLDVFYAIRNGIKYATKNKTQYVYKDVSVITYDVANIYVLTVQRVCENYNDIRSDNNANLSI